MPNQSDPQTPAAIQSPTKNQTPRLTDVVSEILTAFPATKTVLQISQLTAASATLNRLSDELTTEVSEVETTLNKLNLGVRAEVKAAILGTSDSYSHWLRLAYGKEAGRWGFIVEELESDSTHPEGDTYVGWAFKDAPREFRLQVVDKIPTLLEALVKKSNEMADEITKKVKFVKELASSLPKSSPQGSKK